MSLKSFTEAYIESALWSSSDTDDQGNERLLDSGEFELAPETRKAMEQDCATFYSAHSHLFTQESRTHSRAVVDCDEYAGHDFWLTRAGHGCGFWDGDWQEPAATQITEACKQAGERDLYIGDDLLIYQSPA